MVLLTDGMDTRPYRLSWPPSSLIFDVSPDSIYTAASEKLKGTWHAGVPPFGSPSNVCKVPDI
jgi:hypothetical protein